MILKLGEELVQRTIEIALECRIKAQATAVEGDADNAGNLYSVGPYHFKDLGSVAIRGE